MGNVVNPAKVFQWKVEINGIVSFEAQKLTPPSREVEKVLHGDTNHAIKTAGMVVIGDLVLEKLRATPNPDIAADAWLNAAQNTRAGGGGIEAVYKLDIVLRQLNPDGRSTSAIWVAEGAWCHKIESSTYDRTSSENVIETLTLSVDEYYQRL